MHLIFFGSDQYSGVVLSKLSHTLPLTLVVPRPDSPIVKIANQANIKILLYEDFLINLDNIITRGSIGLSASFPRLFPPALINAFRGELYNLHPSLLPQYRNVAPVPYALAMGDTTSGISLFRIIVGIDNGPVVAARESPILPTDTTPVLLNQLFALGAELFGQFIANPADPALTKATPVLSSQQLIFTRRLSRDSGYLEWDVVQKLLQNIPLVAGDTKNPLLKLRLTHYPQRTARILPDLIRALEGYEKVWTTAPGKNGPLNISLLQSPMYDTKYYVLIPGKPRPIPYADFVKYYL